MDTCVEIANINPDTAILAKPCTCTSPPEKRTGALMQNGNRHRSSSLGDRSTKQTAAAASSFQHDQHGQLNSKSNKMRLSNYQADRSLASYMGHFSSARKLNPTKLSCSVQNQFSAAAPCRALPMRR